MLLGDSITVFLAGLLGFLSSVTARHNDEVVVQVNTNVLLNAQNNMVEIDGQAYGILADKYDYNVDPVVENITIPARNTDNRGGGRLTVALMNVLSTFVNRRPLLTGKICNTMCFSETTEDSTAYAICIYRYTKSALGCTTVDIPHLRNVIKDKLLEFARQELTGKCITIFDSNSSVTYAKIVMLGNGISMDDVHCEAPSDWNAPNFFQKSYII